MIKKSVVLLAMFLMAMMLSGCRIVYTYDLSKTNRVKLMEDIYYTEDEYKDGLVSKNAEYKIVTLEDGEKYYKISESKEETVDNYSDLTSVGVIRPDMVYVPQNEADRKGEVIARNENDRIDYEELREMMKVKLVFVLSEDIIETNGILSADKRTVTFVSGDVDGNAMYAYTRSSKNRVDNDKTPPVIKGLKKNQYYNKESMSNLVISDNLALASVKCNGYKMEKGTKMWTFASTGKYRQGKNTLVVTDVSGNKTKFTFLYDDKEPKVIGLKSYYEKKCKNGKAIFYVKDKDSDLKKIEYAKDRQKYKIIPKKNITKVTSGKYKGYYKVVINCKKPCELKVKVYDKAGNYKEFLDMPVTN